MGSRILIVDDHQSVRNGIRTLLTVRPEWEICGEAEDGLDAVEKAKELKPNVVVMDVSMPRMDGLEATRIIRRELPQSQVVIISQNHPSVVRHQAKEVQAAAFVAKNALAQELLPTLDKVFGEFRPGKVEEPASHGPEPKWLAGSAILGRLIREYDWSKTSLGPIERWPQSLKTSISLILNSQHPMWIGWGDEMSFLYNDAYIQVLSLSKHPWALGKPAQEVWSEIWEFCGPLANKVFENGEASFVDEVRLLMKRADFTEETYYSFSYSPIRDESGAVAGLFCPSTEVTPKVINARRLRTLSELSANALLQKTEEAACDSVSATLAKNPEDIPFFVFYLIDAERKQARLQQVCGLPEGIADLTPHSIDLNRENAGRPLWPLAEVLKEGRSQVVSVKHVDGLPLGVGQQRVSQATVLPLSSLGESGTMGVLIAGVSPARKLDTEYLTFYDLIAGQIASAIQNARATEQERERLEALAELDRAKTAFFSNVSHEFRTPLTLMLGPVEDLLAKSHIGLSPSAKSQLELVNRNGSRLLRLVNTLLDFSRIEAGRMQATYQATNLAAFTIDLASVFRSATEKAGLELELDCPELGEPVFVDRGMWEKIVLNLISNAFKFTFEGTITVSLARVQEEVELRVRDTGVGIPQDELPRLFDRFHRVQNTRSRTHEGSGIGLALVQELVKLHGGSVRVESAVGKGTVFIVRVPLGTAHLPAEKIGGTRTLASTAVGARPYVEEALRWLPDSKYGEATEELVPQDELLPVPCRPLAQKDDAENRPRILIADDNADMRQYLARLLSERYAVQTCPDGRAALDAVKVHAPDLVLSDVMMPNLDGFEFLHEMRSNPQTRTIPVILLSARAGEESRVEGMEHGADDYLIKPFSARELLARVQAHLEMARIRKKAEGTNGLLAAIVDFSDDAIISKRLDGTITSWNSAAERMFGYTAEEAIGQNITLIIPHDRWNEEKEIIEKLRRGQRIEHFETVRMRKNGTLLEISLTISPLKDEAGNVVGASKVARDITDRKQVEERERRMKEEAIAATAKFRALFEQTPVFAGIVALDGTVMDANQLSLEACGYRAEEVLGRPFWETGWWRGSEETQSKIREATTQAAKGTAYRETLTYHWADGTERLVDFALHPIRDEQGKILFLHPTGVDITDLKRAEEDYRMLAESLDAEVRARTSELEQRNNEVLRQSEQLRTLSRRLLKAQDQERRRIARELHDSAGQILTQLGMNLARVAQEARQGSAQLTKDTDESQLLVQQLSQEIRTMSYLLHPPLLDEIGLSGALRWYTEGLVERSGMDIRLSIADDFGRLPSDIELVMFRLVQECLTNIHRHSGSRSAAIEVARDEKGVFLSVKDQGKGMSAEELADVRSGGAGVGIRGMRERIRQLDGQMDIESSSRGTEISFKIPIAQSEATRAPVSQPIRAAG